MVIGVAGGLLNGLLTAHTGINGFIVTLATASAFTGINLGITKSVPFYKMPPALVAFGDPHFGPLPALLSPPLLVAPLLGLLLFRLPVGRKLLAAGGNATPPRCRASRSAPCPLAHCHLGRLAAIGAVLAVAQLGSAQPQIGSDWLLLSFAAPIIGGTALSGGHVSIAGTALAVLVIALIQDGMVLAKVDPYWVQFMLGALVLATVGFNRWRAVRCGGC